MRFLFCLSFLVFLMGCGSDPVPAGSLPVVETTNISGVVDLELGPTSTPWPTFTPAPTPTLTLVPTPRPTPTRLLHVPPTRPPPPAPSGELVPEPMVDVTSEPDGMGAEPTVEILLFPTPTPFGKLWSDDAYLVHQGFYPLQSSGQLPDYILDEAWHKLPLSFDTVLSSTPFALWVLVFDTVDAEDDWSMTGTVRWINLNPEGTSPVVMYETEQVVSKEDSYFVRGLGRDTAGFWSPGDYRVEFLDDRYGLVVDWDFRVR